MRMQMKGFQKECVEAARCDGATEWQVFCRIVLPNIRPAVAVLLALTFAEYWNIIDQAVVLIDSPFDMPLSAYFSQLLQSDPALFSASSCLYTVPALLVFGVIFAERKRDVINNVK